MRKTRGMLLIATAWSLALCGTVMGTTLTAPRTTASPVIDGNLESAWDRAVVVDSGWSTNTGGVPGVDTVARVMWNEQYLFVAFISEQDMSSVQARVTEHDGPAHQDDDNEVFVAPFWPTPRPYYQFVTNPNGARFEGMGNDPAWSGEWQVGVQRGDDRWTTEFAIPWSSIEFTPEAGDRLGFNVTRHWIAGNQWITWTPGLRSFHTPELFSTLVLGE